MTVIKKNLSILLVIGYCIAGNAQADQQKAEALLKKMTLIGRM
jgi:hypothetical protein